MATLIYIKWFKELTKDDIPVVGGKGANLGEMWNNQFPVPPGFAVTADAYRTHLKKNNIVEEIQKKLADLNVKDTENLQRTATEIQEIIKSKPMPDTIKEEIIEAYSHLDTSSDLIGVKSAEDLIKAGRDLQFVAVRSSATAEDLPEASFAGQQATFLNIKGNEPVLEAVKNCWASLFTARAIYYRTKNNFDHMKVALSAIVQKMVNSDKAGVMFSVNPATNNINEIVIEGAWGLGEAVVSGAVSPDEYIIDKNTGQLTDKKIKKQTWGFFRSKEGNSEKQDIPKDKQEAQILSDRELTVLARLAKKVEEHYGKPQDMEWAIENSKIYLVQARPVTTLKKPAEEKKPEATGKVLLTGLGASPGIASGPVKIIKEVSELDKIQKGDVLVAPMTNPDMVPAMQRAAAIVTDEGGVTCHAAIVSREMGVPCIVGTGKATQVLKVGEVITVNGSKGEVYEGATVVKEKPEVTPTEAAPAAIATATQIKTIIDLPQFAEKAAATGAQGVGLLRLEGIIATAGKHPGFLVTQGRTEEYTKIIYEGIKAIASAFKDHPVWVRTSDLRTAD
jgi:pyruvate,water dikinase